MSLPKPRPCLAAIASYVPGKTAAPDATPPVRPIKLSANENPYGPSPQALVAYREAGAALHRYPDGGCRLLTEAVAHHTGLPAAQLAFGAGSDELINLLMQAFVDPGGEVIHSAHGFLMYQIYARVVGATPVSVPEKQLCADMEAIIAAVTPRTKAVFLANPNNPTGSYLSARALQRLRAGLPEHVLLVIDSAYAECADAPDYEDGRALVLAGANTVMLRTFSKLYGLPALRLGWMLAPEAVIDAVHRVRSPFNVNQPAQAAGAAAMADGAFIREHHQRNAEQRHILTEGMRALGLEVQPSQGNFVLAVTESAAEAEALVAGLAARHIYVREMTAYRLPHCLRVSVGTPQDNQRLLTALATLR